MSRLVELLMVLALWAPVSHAGQMSTYVKGIVVKKTKSYLILQNNQGTYWISTKKRPPNFTKRYSEIETGFWVRIQDIKKFRPNTSQARQTKDEPLS